MITAQQKLDHLNSKLDHWEKHLKANLERYEREGSQDSARNARTQLGLIEDVREAVS